MAADTAAKRYSAISLSCPWRGLNALPSGSITQGERQAVMYWYSGLLFSTDHGANTKCKRISAMNISCPWRGLNVSPSATISLGERLAVMYFYCREEVVPPPGSFRYRTVGKTIIRIGGYN